MGNYKTNSDRIGRQIADMRARENAKKPATVAQPKTLVSPPVQPAQAMAAASHQTPDWVGVLVEAVKRDGSINLSSYDLSILLGLAAKDQDAMLSILEPERYCLFTKGIRYFPSKGRWGRTIHFRTLALDSQKLFLKTVRRQG